MSVFNIDLHQLMVFYNVAAEESISLAADKLCLTQPTVTYHLRELEQYAGVKLFYIKRSRVYLTDAGQHLFQYTKEIWTQVNQIDKLLDSLKQKRIRIGVTPLLHNVISSALSKLGKLFPEVKIEIISAVSTKVIQQVNDMEIDLGIVMSTDLGTSKIKSLRISDNEKLVLVVSPNHALANKKKVVWADLKNYPIICGQQGSLLYQLLFEKYRKAGVQTPPLAMVETVNIECLRIFAKEGAAIGFWHTKDVEGEVRAGELKILPLVEDVRVPIDIILNQNNEFTQPVIKEVIEYIKQELNKPSKLD
jgi:DNA-binding transcriptional LysR family regulator